MSILEYRDVVTPGWLGNIDCLLVWKELALFRVNIVSTATIVSRNTIQQYYGICL